MVSPTSNPTVWGFSPAEAGRMDLHLILLIDTMSNALNDASWTPDIIQAHAGEIAVLTATTTADFLKPLPAFFASRIAQTALRTQGAHANFEARCASSYLAVQHAVDQIQSSDCINTAIVGGVCLMLRPEWRLTEYEHGILSASGCMRPLAAQADGMVCGEAAGAAVLSTQVTDTDHRVRILAATNAENGNCTPLYGADASAMTGAVSSALRRAGIETAEVCATHLHAMGASASDNAEIASVVATLVKGRSAHNPLILMGHKVSIAVYTITQLDMPLNSDHTQLLLESQLNSDHSCQFDSHEHASLQANIGHSVEAAGILGLIVTTLVLSHRIIPPIINVSELSRKV